MRDAEQRPGRRARGRLGRILLIAAAALVGLALLAPGAEPAEVTVINALVHG